jgi:hypothetical protein
MIEILSVKRIAMSPSMGAGARRWRRSNFPNLTEHIAPHKDRIGISCAKAIVDAPLQHRLLYQAKPMPYRTGTGGAQHALRRRMRVA